MKIRISNKTVNSKGLLKETAQQRYERVTTAGSEMRTRVVPSKKHLTRDQQKVLDRRSHEI